MPKPSAIKKTIAVTLALILLNNAVMPGIAYALTSGPQRPESTSFEPVDTTDMVNLLSGDLAYNIPLLEVPGQEGGYPLSLSYHAGMQPEEEASWVGLGWTLNPGAIDRTVSGFPDDFNGQQNTARDYWDGGRRTTTSVGVNVGLPGILSADIGVSIGHDTFLGTGIGGYVGLSASLFKEALKGTPFGVSASLGVSVDPFGGMSMYGGIGGGVGVGVGEKSSLTGSLGLNFSTNFQSLNVGASAGIGASLNKTVKGEDGKSSTSSIGTSLLGASIKSGGGGFSLSTGGGYSNVENVNAGKISTSSSHWGFTVPVWFGVSLSLSHTYMRYWSDETSNVQTFGSLHPAQTRGYSYNTEYDTYYLADITDTTYSLTNASKNDPVKSTGGTLPDYDTYSVLAQGVSGYIRPYGYQQELIGKGENSSSSMFLTNRQINNTTTTYETRYYETDYNGVQEEVAGCGLNDPNCQEVTVPVTTITTTLNNPSKLNFRFLNDFSNRYLQQDLPFNSIMAQFDTNQIYGLNDGNYGYDPASERLSSSKNIEYFTNDEIKNGTAALKGFINTQAKGFDRTKNPNGTGITSPDERIGGFMITNESGVTYHYALPVYAYNEYTKTELISNIQQYNEQTRKNPYATSWLLTAVTGPDYVDANHDGQVDQGDWGYWVDFEYGKWTSGYSWRTPYSGTNKDLDQKFHYYSSGNKELYYLDAIITPSHTAIFSKEIRNDGKSSIQGWGSGSYAVSQLRVNDILLFNNKDLSLNLDQMRNYGGEYYNNIYYDLNDDSGLTGSIQLHNSENIIDLQDVAALNLSSKIIRDIKFNYDYSLCSQTPNSFDPGKVEYTTSNYNAAALPKTGKLTLNSIAFLGKQGQESIPPTKFDYEIPAEQIKTSTVYYTGQKTNSNVYTFQDPQSVFSEGDIVGMSLDAIGNPYRVGNPPLNGWFFGLVKAVGSNGGNGNILDVKFIGTPPVSAGGVGASYTFSTTKNPPYSPDCHDMWGMYKADFQDNPSNENLARLPSRASAKSSDVWSLRRIHHALGMTTDIVYEPDIYSKVALYQNASITISKIEPGSGANDIVVTSTGDFGIDLRDFIRVGDKVQMIFAGTYVEDISGGGDGVGNYITNNVSISSGSAPTLLVTNVTETTITVTDASFYNAVFHDQSGATFYGGNLSAGGIGNNYGGGLRIKQIVNKEPITGVTMAVNYNYNYPSTNSTNYPSLPLSSGTTSYEPVGIDAVNLRTVPSDNYQAVLAKNFSNLLGLARLVPAPGVMYEYVGVTTSRTVDGQTVEQLGGSEYQFEVFNKGMVGYWNENPQKSAYVEYSNVVIQNYTSRIGNLKRMIKYDKDGKKLSETVNHYLYDEQTSESAQSNHDQYENLMARYNKQGLITERTAEGRYNDGKYRNVMTLNETFPNITTGSTTIDYKTGLISNTATLGFDFYSGQPTKTLSYDSYGNRFISENTPAYRIYPQMGLKSMNYDNKNMLSQVAQDVTYTADAGNNYTGVLSASATTWSNQGTMLNDLEQPVNTQTANTRATMASGTDQLNIWRPYQTYQWMPTDRTSGTTPLSSFLSFFAAGGSTQPAWVKNSEITLYNIYSNALEAKDINGNYGSTMMGYSQSKVVSNASNANYKETTYAGLEDGVISGTSLPRGVNLGSAIITNVASHTGNYSAQLNSGQSGLNYNVNTSNLKTGRNYTACVWMKTNGNPTLAQLYYSINGGSATTSTINIAKKAGDWYLLTLQIPGSNIQPGNTLTVGCVNNGSIIAYFDDFRFKPINASMTSYVYDASTGELTYILDGNNMFAQFQYDSEGRLTKTFKENFGYGVKQVSENVYNYAQH